VAALLMLPNSLTAASNPSKAGSAVGVPALSRKNQSGRISTFIATSFICKILHIEVLRIGC
jgi:hypothetical protein